MLFCLSLLKSTQNATFILDSIPTGPKSLWSLIGCNEAVHPPPQDSSRIHVSDSSYQGGAERQRAE